MSTARTNQFHLIDDTSIATLTLAAVKRTETAAITTRSAVATMLRRQPA
ncbi:MAG: hypothetical protein GY814_19495, partial [Gammaproteobacteria bacterium]|nr:hypothetical protein [Gammaproteobacteria bacterium]